MRGNFSPVEEIEPGVWDYITTYKPHSRRTYFHRSRRVLEHAGRDLNKCHVCGYQGNRVHIHHTDRDITNCRSDNLLVLCLRCHKKAHPERLNFKYEDLYLDVSTE